MASCYLTNKFPNFTHLEDEEFNEVISNELLELLCIRNKDNYQKIKDTNEEFFYKTVGINTNCLYKEKILANIKF